MRIGTNFLPMDDLRISLTDPLQTFVDEQVAAGDYGNAADYVAALIEAEAKARAQEKLEALLLEGLDSEETEWTEADWDDLRRRASGVETRQFSHPRRGPARSRSA